MLKPTGVFINSTILENYSKKKIPGKVFQLLKAGSPIKESCKENMFRLKRSVSSLLYFLCHICSLPVLAVWDSWQFLLLSTSSPLALLPSSSPSPYVAVMQALEYYGITCMEGP